MVGRLPTTKDKSAEEPSSDMFRRSVRSFVNGGSGCFVSINAGQKFALREPCISGLM